MTNLPVIDSIRSKFDALRQRLQGVSTETIEADRSAGRVLAESVVSYRDSPALDVSAMDGYAVRLTDVPQGTLPVCGIACAGAPPIQCLSGQAVRIFTGGVVPSGADCVIPREHCQEDPDCVRVAVSIDSLRIGQNIRFRGENASKGTLFLEAGTLIDGPAISSLVSLSDADPIRVYRPLRVAILNTGDELVEPGRSVRDWQIRDSNGPLLSAMLSEHAWIQSVRSKVPDEPMQTRRALSDALRDSDAVILTGGVSMGDTDYVPQSILDCGGEVVFHRIPIRPGKPLLGGLGAQGQLILGLPGNPVSVAVTFRRYGLELLRHISGFRVSDEHALSVPVACTDKKRLDLVWFRLVQRQPSGGVSILANQGSGDLISLSKSDGFVEIPPGAESQGTFPFYAWTGIWRG